MKEYQIVPDTNRTQLAYYVGLMVKALEDKNDVVLDVLAHNVIDWIAVYKPEATEDEE